MSGLVLASASAARQSLLRQAGVDFQVAPADINETALMDDLIAKGTEAGAIARALAEQKAVMVSRRMPGRLVLGGDSILSFGSEIFGKSANLSALRTLLKKLSGRTHVLVSAAALARDGAVVWQHADRARLTMRHFSDAFLDAYLAAEGQAALSCVGGYRYEGRGAQLFEQVQGEYFAILGLPLLPVLAALRPQGILES